MALRACRLAGLKARKPEGKNGAGATLSRHHSIYGKADRWLRSGKATGGPRMRERRCRLPERGCLCRAAAYGRERAKPLGWAAHARARVPSRCLWSRPGKDDRYGSDLARMTVMARKATVSPRFAFCDQALSWKCMRTLAPRGRKPCHNGHPCQKEAITVILATTCPDPNPSAGNRFPRWGAYGRAAAICSNAWR